jgi:hypothetical protein
MGHPPVDIPDAPKFLTKRRLSCPARGARAYDCGGAAVPCPACNLPEEAKRGGSRKSHRLGDYPG